MSWVIVPAVSPTFVRCRPLESAREVARLARDWRAPRRRGREGSALRATPAAPERVLGLRRRSARELGHSAHWSRIRLGLRCSSHRPRGRRTVMRPLALCLLTFVVAAAATGSALAHPASFRAVATVTTHGELPVNFQESGFHKHTSLTYRLQAFGSGTYTCSGAFWGLILFGGPSWDTPTQRATLTADGHGRVAGTLGHPLPLLLGHVQVTSGSGGSHALPRG
jgi:hypothetical protein